MDRHKQPIPYGRQQISEEDIAAVVQVLRSDWLTCGPAIETFEQALCEACGARHAIAVSNGTAALHVAMLAAGIGPGDRVLTSPNTFVASANCAAYVGATPDFADMDPVTRNLSPEALRAHWQEDVRAVVAVDFAGYPCDMPRIAELARSKGAVVIEDAAHALGAQFQSQGRWHKTGGHPWADLTTLSFHPVKTITTGEGGAILTQDPRLADRCRTLRTHGIVKHESRFQAANGVPLLSERGPWYYEMQMLGYNYRITDIQCALGLSQLRRLPAFISRRQAIVDQYNHAFRALPLVRTPMPAGQVTDGFGPVLPSWHLYVLEIDFAALGITRTAFMQELRARGVGSQVHYIPVHLQPFYAQTYGYRPGLCPAAESYYARCLSLPLYPSMSSGEVARVITGVTELVCRAK
jgi:UDP-4-amino-4,6-dideoxy-N-acetyl-beta-L-altrosamine transaminase